MGKILSVMGRRSQHASVQQRIDKINSKDKPLMHSLYPTEEKILNKIRFENNPELNSKIAERRMDLEENVNKLRIVSRAAFQNTNVVESTAPTNDDAKSNRLPKDRILRKDSEFGFYEEADKVASPGKISFRECMKLLRSANEKEKDEPILVSQLASDFKIDEEKTKAVVTYFVPFSKSFDYDFVKDGNREPLPIQTPELKAEITAKAYAGHARDVRLHKIQYQQTMKIIEEVELAKKAKDEGTDKDSIGNVGKN